MEQLCSTQQVSVSSSSSQRDLETRQTEAQRPVAGLEKMDHIKTTQADCKWAWEQTAGSGAGTGWRRLGKAGSQQARPDDSTSPIIHTALSHSGGIMGIFRTFFPSLTLSVTDSYLHWLTLRELAGCWMRGGTRLIDCLPAGWWLASEETAGPQPTAIFLRR